LSHSCDASNGQPDQAPRVRRCLMHAGGDCRGDSIAAGRPGLGVEDDVAVVGPLRTFGEVVRHGRLGYLAIEIPLPEIGREHLVDVYVDATEQRTGVRRAVDDLLVKHRLGLALSVRPGLGLPSPSVPRSG
jgi:hypothetical protein